MTAEERSRYSRQILFQGVGEEGQERLLASRAAIVGCGALGSFQAAALARAGVGRLTIIDRDYVEPSNLQRQWLFEESDAAQALPKAVAAERRIAAINSSVQVYGLVADLTPSNISDLLAHAQVIVDGTDNFETRYLINDFAVRSGIPWIYGAAVWKLWNYNAGDSRAHGLPALRLSGSRRPALSQLARRREFSTRSRG